MACAAEGAVGDLPHTPPDDLIHSTQESSVSPHCSLSHSPSSPRSGQLSLAFFLSANTINQRSMEEAHSH